LLHPSQLPLSAIQIDPTAQARFSLDPEQLRELVDSIRTVGILCPITVHQRDDAYILVAGHRRLAAAHLAGLPTIPVHVVDLTVDLTRAATIAENLVRSDLTPVEEAHAIVHLLDLANGDLDQVASHLHRTREWVARRALLATYPPDILEHVHARRISLAVADELAPIDHAPTRVELTASAIQHGCSGRVAALWRATAAAAAPTGHSPFETPTPPVVGPPPRVLRECLCCHQPYDVRTMSYVTLCADCATAVTSATPQQAAACAPSSSQAAATLDRDASR